MKEPMWEVELVGGRKIVVGEKEAKEAEKMWKSGSFSKIGIGGSNVLASIIRGFFPISSPSYSGFSKQIEDIDKEFFTELDTLSKQSPREKSVREMKRRVSPGLKLSGITSGDQIVQIIYKDIFEFHSSNPNWPWCPTKIWWEKIKPYLKEGLHVSRWYLYIFRHDEQVERWYRKKNGTANISKSLLTASS